MSNISLILLFGFMLMTFANIEQVKEHLQSSGKKLSLIGFATPPEPISYLNHDLIQNSPHKINLTNELTKIIREWSPRLLALDPTSPYYYSKLNNISQPDDDPNLLSYLQAIELNQTLLNPFINILPQTYRSALPLLSIFRCSEFVYATSNPFFHNLELIVGPGQSELALERQSDMFSQLYCSLYGWPNFLLINQTKQPTMTYNNETLLSQDDLSNIEYISTNLIPGTCLFIPPDWVTGIQLNNSISLLFTLTKITKLPTDNNDNESLPCTPTGETTLENIDFVISDTFNVTEIGLIVYFYQYLNPPIFDRQFTSEEFFDHFQQDKNVSQLIMNWTPELTKLIKYKLFKQLDINNDKKFSADDYFDIKQSDLKQLQNSIHSILEKLRQIILTQYNDLHSMMTKLSQNIGDGGIEESLRETLEKMMENLPDQVKEKLVESNVDVKDVLNKIKQKKSKRPSTTSTKQNTREDDASIIFDKNQVDDNQFINEQEQQEEEITAEPYRTDL